jgi:hypothetical protein
MRVGAYDFIPKSLSNANTKRVKFDNADVTFGEMNPIMKFNTTFVLPQREEYKTLFVRLMSAQSMYTPSTRDDTIGTSVNFRSVTTSALVPSITNSGSSLVIPDWDTLESVRVAVNGCEVYRSVEQHATEDATMSMLAYCKRNGTSIRYGIPGPYSNPVTLSKNATHIIELAGISNEAVTVNLRTEQIGTTQTYTVPLLVSTYTAVAEVDDNGNVTLRT